MNMITVIADDITGAAEIAGIGLRFGLKVCLITKPEIIPQCDLLVYATDTRSMPEPDAINETRKIIRYLLDAGCNEFFNKTDSALRGYINTGLYMLMNELGFGKSLLIPQNPSKNRVIIDGIYYINNIPLDKTSFADDPEFPAKTSKIKDLLQGVEIINSPEDITEEGIFIANADSCNQIRYYLENINSKMLLAGGADLFTEYLHLKGIKEKKSNSGFEGLKDKNTILICGSTANRELSTFAYFKRKSMQFCSMPSDVFEGKDFDEWIKELESLYLKEKSIVISINQPPKESKDVAIRLKKILAEATTSLINSLHPEELILEGGATAFAVLNKLGWHNFQLIDEISPGVVRMSLSENKNIYITLKPGSYEWGNKIFK